jgi:hydrogenase maturation protease
MTRTDSSSNLARNEDRLPMPRVLVLGLGNDILGDDAVGLHIADAVRIMLAGEPGIEVKATTEMGLALLDEIVGREGLLLVDAVQTGRVPAGYIHEMAPEDLPGVLATVPHFLGIRETLALGRLLGLPMPRLVEIVAVEIADPFTLGTALTPTAARAVDPAAYRVAARARAFAESTNS